MEESNDSLQLLEVDQEREMFTSGSLYQCPKCSRSFKRSNHFKCHFFQVHSEFRLADYMILSDVPEEMLPTQKYLKSSTASDNRTYKCTECNREFKKKSSLAMHSIRMHHEGKLYICNVCGKYFSKEFMHANHIKLHHQGINEKSKSRLKHKKTKPKGLKRHLGVKKPKEEKL